MRSNEKVFTFWILTNRTYTQKHKMPKRNAIAEACQWLQTTATSMSDILMLDLLGNN